jgi:L-amino acid N-acyltransferase YncA
MTITKLLAEHWPAVKAIYEEGIATGNATFQMEAPEWATWDAAHLPHSRLVALSEPRPITSSPDPQQSAPSEPPVVLGWAALSPVSSRPVYAGVAEVSVYITAGQRGRKIGECLLGMLIAESEQHGIWTLQASIFPENVASLRIHARCGFRQIGYRERIGQMHGVWRDTVLVERRAATP